MPAPHNITGLIANANVLADDPTETLTNVPTHFKPGLPPFMRQQNRWEYLKEYIYEFWMVGKKAQVKAAFFLIGGILALPYFAPGAMVLFMLAGRNYSISWWGLNVAKTFGHGRTLVMTK